jgi:hypothetical protein
MLYVIHDQVEAMTRPPRVGDAAVLGGALAVGLGSALENAFRDPG